MSVKTQFNQQVSKVKELLAGIFEEVPAAGDLAGAGTLQNYTTDSGAVVMIDKLEVGGKVYDTDGTTPVKTGFTLADGTVVQVDESGVITSVAAPIMAADPLAAPTPAPQPAAPVIPSMFDERLSALETEFMLYKQAIKDGWQEKFNTLETKHQAELQKFQTALNGVVGLVEKFGELPAEDPAAAPRNTGEETIITKTERRAAFAQSIAGRKAKV